jgi:hypothetical protein
LGLLLDALAGTPPGGDALALPGGAARCTALLSRRALSGGACAASEAVSKKKLTESGAS